MSANVVKFFFLNCSQKFVELGIFFIGFWLLPFVNLCQYCLSVMLLVYFIIFLLILLWHLHSAILNLVLRSVSEAVIHHFVPRLFVFKDVRLFHNVFVYSIMAKLHFSHRFLDSLQNSIALFFFYRTLQIVSYAPSKIALQISLQISSENFLFACSGHLSL